MRNNEQLTMLKEYLDDRKAFDTDLPIIVQHLVSSISGELPEKMKTSIAVSEAILFASQMRNNVILPDGTKVPINAITFVLSGSGTNKDRTANTVRKCFSAGYKEIAELREQAAVRKAVRKAEADNCPDPDAEYKRYYVKPKPLFASIGTQEGMISYMNNLETDGIGAAYVYSG